MIYRLEIKGINTGWMVVNTYTDQEQALEHLDILQTIMTSCWTARVIGSDGREVTR